MVHVIKDRTEFSKFRNEIEMSRKDMTNHSRNIENSSIYLNILIYLN